MGCSPSQSPHPHCDRGPSSGQTDPRALPGHNPKDRHSRPQNPLPIKARGGRQVPAQPPTSFGLTESPGSARPAQRDHRAWRAETPRFTPRLGRRQLSLDAQKFRLPVSSWEHGCPGGQWACGELSSHNDCGPQRAPTAAPGDCPHHELTRRLGSRDAPPPLPAARTARKAEKSLYCAGQSRPSLQQVVEVVQALAQLPDGQPDAQLPGQLKPHLQGLRRGRRRCGCSGNGPRPEPAQPPPPRWGPGLLAEGCPRCPHPGTGQPTRTFSVG